MTIQLTRYRWHVAGTSVRGTAHQRDGQPNHDAIAWTIDPDTSIPLILAVADGYRGGKSFRSNIGARLAVEVTLAELQNLLADHPDQPTLSAIRQTAEEQLPQRIVCSWRTAVENDLNEHPLTGDVQLQRLLEDEGSEAGQAVLDNPYLAYGTTLLAALVTDTFILYLQLGDGDILCVDSLGQSLRPLPHIKRRALADETTLLCSTESWKEMRVRLTPIVDVTPPALVLLSTDEYANSFPSEAEFLKIGPHYLDLVRTRGLANVQQSLARILTDGSQRGIGDDMTIGIIKRIEDDDWDVKDQLIKSAHQNIQLLQQEVEQHVATWRAEFEQLQRVLESKTSLVEVQPLLEAEAQARTEGIAKLTKARDEQHTEIMRLVAAGAEQNTLINDIQSTLEGAQIDLWKSQVNDLRLIAIIGAVAAVLALVLAIIALAIR